eukprot:5250375-Alexandrium_andersonii.AAC.1
MCIRDRSRPPEVLAAGSCRHCGGSVAGQGPVAHQAPLGPPWESPVAHTRRVPAAPAANYVAPHQGSWYAGPPVQLPRQAV